MAQSHIADDDVPNLHFQGFARVNLTALEFSSAPSARSAEHRPISDKGVDRLLRIFRTEGCKREDENHFITGWVRNEQLEGVASGRDGCLRTVPPIAWEDVPCLDVRPIQCLNGLHRIHAAKKYLNGGDRWWVIRLCTKGDSGSSSLWPPSRPISLIEESKNEQGYSDGYIFRKIRLYHKQSNEYEEKKWWARLSGTKADELHQLLRDQRFANAFDELLPWGGLWETIQLGSLHRLLPMKCHEVRKQRFGNKRHR